MLVMVVSLSAVSGGVVSAVSVWCCQQPDCVSSAVSDDVTPTVNNDVVSTASDK